MRNNCSIYNLSILSLFSIFSLFSNSIQANTPYDDYFKQFSKDSVQVENSDWYRFEKKLYTNILGQTKADILIVPAQVQQFAIDKVGRDLITFSTVNYFESNTQKKILDPIFVEFALGENKRTFEAKDVFRLANATGVKQIIWVYIGHTQELGFNLTLMVQNKINNEPLSRSTPIKKKDWMNNNFSDLSLPYEIYNKLLPEIGDFVGLTSNKKTSLPVYSSYDQNNISNKPNAIINNSITDLLESIYTYQLLGSIVPTNQNRLRERYYAKSLSLLNNISNKSKDYSILKARALYHLNRRPAALAALGKPKTSVEMALHYTLMGDYNNLRNSLNNISNPIKKLLATIEFIDMHWSYTKPTLSKSDIDKYANIEGIGHWKDFLFTRFNDLNYWKIEGNLKLSKALDELYPLKGKNTLNLISEKFGLGSQIGDDVEIAAFNHIRNLLSTPSKKWCCAGSFLTPKSIDYLWLLASISDDNIFKILDFYLTVQGNPQKANDLIKRFEPAYKGHPRYYAITSETLFKLSKSARGAMKQRLLSASVQNARSAYYWAQEQNEITKSMAKFLLFHTKVIPFYHADFPRRYYWFEDASMTDRNFLDKETANIENSSIMLAYSALDFNILVNFQAVMESAKLEESKISFLVDRESDRYKGHPDRANYFASQSIKNGDVEQAKSIYKKETEENSGNWSSYIGLGTLLLKEGKSSDATDVFKSFPFFKKRNNIHKVALANHAAQAATALFMRGFYTEAKYFIDIGLDLKTNSRLNLQSDYLSTLIEPNYLNSLKTTLSISKRYSDNGSLSDYLKWLNLFGHQEMSKSIFQSVINKHPQTMGWGSIAMNMKMAKSDSADLVNWLDKNTSDSSNSWGKSQVIFRSLAEDRIPPDNLKQLVERYEGNQESYVKDNKYVYLIPSGSKFHIKAGPDSYNNFNLREISENTKIPSQLSMFAKAYTYLINEDYDKSLSTFIEYSKFYSNTNEYFKYTLPYFVWSHIKSDNTKKIEEYLKQLPDDLSIVKLSLALIYANKNEHDKAIQLMNDYVYSLESAAGSPFSNLYMFVEINEWVYAETGEQRYANLALKWAKHVQTITPFHAWSYAVEAKYETDPKTRLLALGIAIYLDAQSRRVNQFSLKTRQSAKKYAEKRNPFTNKHLNLKELTI